LCAGGQAAVTDVDFRGGGGSGEVPAVLDFIAGADGQAAAPMQSLGQIDAGGWEQLAREHGTVEKWFHALVRAHFKGNTKPPFNEEAREKAGFTKSWYEPLIVDCPE
jgi:hypothetical protein